MKAITTHTFKHTIRDIHKNTDSRKFCFIIGAGASYKSGIPTGGKLAETWFSEIKERLQEAELKEWIKARSINEKDLASCYGSIYRKRFENDKSSGYESLVQAMKNAKPSLGHFVLAQILSRVPGHCVLTTNFDSLVESSIYQFTNKTPLVCGHESLSGYARPSQTHPLIVKIHRDLLLEPKSDPDEINKLDGHWKEPLDHIFSNHIPVVIGYGGNDGSLMEYFECMNKPSNFFWCGLDERNVSERIKKLILKHDGSFVTIDGFDELMHELLWVFDEIKPFEEELNEITNERIQIVTKQLKEISLIKVEVKTKSAKDAQTIRKIKELSALEYSKLANSELDYEKRKNIYLEALSKYPLTGWLWEEFTYFLHFIKKDYQNLDEIYRNGVKYNKHSIGINSNYAIFLKNIIKDYAKAEEYYLKTLAIDPNDAGATGNYALFLGDVKKDYTKAEEYYLKALAIDPNDANVNVNYALFLKEIKKDYLKAEEYYLKALAVDKENANSNGNYTQILLESGRAKEAEHYLIKALNNTENDDLLIELWFYRFAHYPEMQNEAESKIEELLSEGIRSIGWDFSGNIEQAIKHKHPDLAKLRELARRITNP